MPKVCAVFEKPTRCSTCPCYHLYESGAGYCELANQVYGRSIEYELPYYWSQKSIPDWCPLIPSDKDVSTVSKKAIEATNGLVDIWNNK